MSVVRRSCLADAAHCTQELEKSVRGEEERFTLQVTSAMPVPVCACIEYKEDCMLCYMRAAAGPCKHSVQFCTE